MKSMPGDSRGRSIGAELFRAGGIGALCLFCLVPFFMGGCVVLPVGVPDRTGKVRFSPDGRIVAYIWHDHIVTFSLVYPPVSAGSTAHVRWAEVASPDKQRSARIDAAFIGWNHDGLEGHVHPVFSPDSRHLAVVSPQRLVIVELSSGRQRTMTDSHDEVTSLTWPSNDEIAYAAHVRKDTDKGLSKRTIWRQRIHESPAARRAVHRQDDVRVMNSNALPWQLEQWSPNAKYVVFHNGSMREPYKLLNVDTGELWAIGRMNGSPYGAAWKPDSSGVFCLTASHWGDGLAECEAIVVDPTTGKRRDYSARFQDAFAEWLPSFGISAPAGWTPDGQYLIGSHLDLGGCLIRLDPWEVIPLGKRLRDKIGANYTPVAMVALPVNGWLRTKGLERNYLVDYSGRPMREIENANLCAWSADGKHFAKVDRRGAITVETLELPSPSGESSHGGLSGGKGLGKPSR